MQGLWVEALRDVEEMAASLGDEKVAVEASELSRRAADATVPRRIRAQGDPNPSGAREVGDEAGASGVHRPSGRVPSARHVPGGCPRVRAAPGPPDHTAGAVTPRRASTTVDTGSRVNHS